MTAGDVWASGKTGVVTDESVGNDGVIGDNANNVTDDTDRWYYFSEKRVELLRLM